MQVNTQSIVDFALYFHSVWSSPLEIALSFLLLYFYIGWAMFAGLGALLVLLPYNGYITGELKKVETSKIKAKDSRIKMINEILKGMKVNLLKFAIYRS